jgi:hypothetical protein
MTILAIDPGDKHSAFAEIEEDTCRPLQVGKVPNGELLKAMRFSIQAYNPGTRTEGEGRRDRVEGHFGQGWPPLSPPRPLLNLAGDAVLTRPDRVAIEMISSYGMPVGREIFDTCIWIGRFIEVAPAEVKLVSRKDVVLHHCHNGRAKDSNVTQALIDRFAPGVRNRGKGTKTEPGWFHGFHHDVWQAYALAVYYADTQQGKDATP